LRVKAKATQKATTVTPISKHMLLATWVGHWSKKSGLTNSMAAVNGK
jgi:hypothetical protein